MHLPGERARNTIRTRCSAEPDSVRSGGGPFCTVAYADEGADKYEEEMEVVSCPVSLNVPTATKSTGPVEYVFQFVHVHVRCVLAARPLAGFLSN